MERHDLKYHFFIAHSAADKEFATRLYHLLLGGYEVFLASESILPGDYWDEEIPKAQRDSMITLILVSPNTEASFFQKEEIQIAIELCRQKNTLYRVIPVYLSNVNKTLAVPYGLQRIQGIYTKGYDASVIMEKLELLLKGLTENGKVRKNPGKGKRNLSNKNQASLYKDSKEGIALRIETALEDIRLNHEENRNPLSLLYMDLDSFTGINKKFGSIVGERIISAIESILHENFQANFYARLFGDEFLICLCHTGDEEGVELGEKLRESIKTYPWSSIAFDLHVTASIGVAQLNSQELTREWILRAIHGAILAKRDNGNLVKKSPFALPKNISRNIGDYSSWRYS